MTEVVEPRLLHRELGLTDAEFERICKLLRRPPNDFELAVFSLLWSEHCSYKHSARALRRLPATGARVLGGPGENAGVVDIGDGQAVAFKVESHNHPSAVEPFQGAATGVGGILRDVVAMGARPIALLDLLRFAEPRSDFDRAVAGIGHYGNCVGVPTVGGEAHFDAAYRFNPLVNAMCVGLLPVDRVLHARARTPGSLVVLYGATTGRDGIGGASVLASQELGEQPLELRPSVQIGDPFTGNKLIEASAELVERDLVEALQDLGAAGLASALAELAGDDAGIDVELAAVPLRETGLEPWEIMISESQERMLAVVDASRAGGVAEVCARWELECAVVGEVTASGALRCFYGRELVGDIPARLLTDEAPRYELRPAPRATRRRDVPASAPTVEGALLAILRSPNVRRRAWIYEQFDQLVGSRTVRRPGLDAAVLRLRPSLRGLAVSLDGGSRACALDPRAGAAAAVFEAARNVACAGATPLAITDCLNLGSPERPETAWDLLEVIEGIAEACEALAVPVVSGNVSLYNETDGLPIPPTPVIGCVGLMDDVRSVPRGWRPGDAVLLASASAVTLEGSEYAALFGTPAGRGLRLELAAEAALVAFLAVAARRASLVHDVAAGGLAACLARAALVSGCGAELELHTDPLTRFGEGGGRAVIACDDEVAGELAESAPAGIAVRRLGSAGGGGLLGLPLETLREAWEPAA